MRFDPMQGAWANIILMALHKGNGDMPLVWMSGAIAIAFLILAFAQAPKRPASTAQEAENP